MKNRYQPVTVEVRGILPYKLNITKSLGDIWFNIFQDLPPCRAIFNLQKSYLIPGKLRDSSMGQMQQYAKGTHRQVVLTQMLGLASE